MVLQVSQELCTGCGVCMEACSVGAIQLVDLQAVIDEVLCTQCEACVDACPNEAITAVSIPVRSMPTAEMPAAESQIVPVQSKVELPETTSPARGIVQLAGATLAFLGREAAPRLIDVLITALEHRLARPETTTGTPVSTSSRSHAEWGRGERKQARYRGRRGEKRNRRERR
jgi:NAD-dependent dihydropyrimidine dehydrogenase PreA subunit